MKIIIETYKKNGQNKVWIGHEDGSGSTFSYNRLEDLLQLLEEYIRWNEDVD